MRMCKVCTGCGRCNGDESAMRREPCPNCGARNKKYDDRCRACGAVLAPEISHREADHGA